MLLSMTISKRILIFSTIILTAVLLAACGIATPVSVSTATTVPTSTSVIPTSTEPPPTPANTPTLVQGLSTPELIDQALARGEITEEERLLYLAYALFEHESLPIRFRSKYGWFGEEAAEELIEVVSSPAKLCSMSPFVRSELLRLIRKKDDDTVCN